MIIKIKMKEKEELASILSEIQIMKEKINKLEKENYNINQLLSEQNERYETNIVIKKEINNIKNRQEQFESSIQQNISSFKNEIINDLNVMNSKFMENNKIITNENNNCENCDINSDDLENNNENDIKKNPRIDNMKYLKHNYSKDSIKSALLVQKDGINYKKNIYEENLNKELIQYREELNKNEVKLSLLENKYNNLNTQYQSDIKTIKDILETLKNYQKNYETFKNNTLLNMKKYKNNLEHNATNNKLFITDITNLIENFQKKLNYFEKNYTQSNDNNSEKKNDLDKILKNINQTLNNEMNEFHLEINKQVREHTREIENFEKFISQEHEKFVEFIQNRLDESISSIKKLFDFNADDIKKLNDKIEIIQDIIKKVRSDVFKSINDSEEFLENKYQSLFRLINKE